MATTAFPVTTGNMKVSDGMDLRDWFAAQAMTALIRAPGMQAGLAASGLRDPAQAIADGAYDYANAMMKARGK